MTSNWLTAKEAAQLLGISVSTLYSYVSRGRLSSQLPPGKRVKRYLKDEVLRLLARSQDSKRAGNAAQSAIDWGVPILESSITLVAEGKLYYRGHWLNDLARSHSLEQAALILWDCPDPSLFSTEPCRQICHQAGASAKAYLSASAGLAPLERAMLLLPAMAQQFALVNANQYQQAAAWMACLARALLGEFDLARYGEHLHQQVAGVWGLDAAMAEKIRVALLVCADHELNVSTFTVRCVASTGANLGMVLCAGLAALSGPRHGGESLRVGAFLRQALALPDIERQQFLQRQLRSHDAREHFAHKLPGFGHPLYPEGDPRGALLMALLNRQEQAALFNLAHLGSVLSGQAVNLDFGLAALELAASLPPGAAQVLFALGRCAGWLAHALEQIEMGQLIRPRARYVGKFAPEVGAGPDAQ